MSSTNTGPTITHDSLQTREGETDEEAGRRNNVRTLYEEVEWERNETVRNESGVLLRTAKDEMHWWTGHFERVLNHEEPPNPEVEPGKSMNITRVEIKKC